MSGLTEIERIILDASWGDMTPLASDFCVDRRPVVREMASLARRGLLTVKVDKHGATYRRTAAGKAALRGA